MQSPEDSILLRVEGLTKHFEGLAAVDGVDIEVRRGELRAIIGPNGAGKTTFFSLVSGGLTPTAGKVYFNGEDITAFPPDRIVKKGIGRTFQVTSIFPNLTAVDNIQSAIQGRKGSPHPFRSLHSLRDTWEQAQETLELLGMGDRANVLVSELSHGEQKLVDIGIALGSDPEMLLLDEPTAGLGAASTHAMTDKIQRLSETRTIMIVEHDMKVIMTLAERISVLHHGKMLAEGTPDEIQADAEVRRVYLTRGV